MADEDGDQKETTMNENPEDDSQQLPTQEMKLYTWGRNACGSSDRD